MADFATALRGRLTGLAAGTRVYWGMVPQGTALPYVRMQTISDERPTDLDGYQARREPRVQVDCFALEKSKGGGGHEQARALAESIVTTLATPGTFGGVAFGFVRASGPRDLGEDTSAGFVHRASLDLIVEHRLA